MIIHVILFHFVVYLCNLGIRLIVINCLKITRRIRRKVRTAYKRERGRDAGVMATVLVERDRGGEELVWECMFE